MSAEKPNKPSPSDPQGKKGAEGGVHKLSGIWTESVDTVATDMLASQQEGISPALKAILQGAKGGGAPKPRPDAADPHLLGGDSSSLPNTADASDSDDLPPGGTASSDLAVLPDDEPFSVMDGDQAALDASDALRTSELDDGRSALDDSMVVSPGGPKLSDMSGGNPLSDLIAAVTGAAPTQSERTSGWQVERGEADDQDETLFGRQSVLLEDDSAPLPGAGPPTAFMRMMEDMAEDSSVSENRSALERKIEEAALAAESLVVVEPVYETEPVVVAPPAFEPPPPFVPSSFVPPRVEAPAPPKAPEAKPTAPPKPIAASAPTPPIEKKPEPKAADPKKGGKPGEPWGVQRISGIWTASVDVLANDMAPGGNGAFGMSDSSSSLTTSTFAPPSAAPKTPVAPPAPTSPAAQASPAAPKASAPGKPTPPKANTLQSPSNAPFGFPVSTPTPTRKPPAPISLPAAPPPSGLSTASNSSAAGSPSPVAPRPTSGVPSPVSSAGGSGPLPPVAKRPTAPASSSPSPVGNPGGSGHLPPVAPRKSDAAAPAPAPVSAAPVSTPPVGAAEAPAVAEAPAAPAPVAPAAVLPGVPVKLAPETPSSVGKLSSPVSRPAPETPSSVARKAPPPVGPLKTPAVPNAFELLSEPPPAAAAPRPPVVPAAPRVEPPAAPAAEAAPAGEPSSQHKISGIWTNSIDEPRPAEKPVPPAAPAPIVLSGPAASSPVAPASPAPPVLGTKSAPSSAAAAIIEGLWRKTNVEESVNRAKGEAPASAGAHKISGIWTNSIDNVAADMMREPIAPIPDDAPTPSADVVLPRSALFGAASALTPEGAGDALADDAAQDDKPLSNTGADVLEDDGSIHKDSLEEIAEATGRSGPPADPASPGRSSGLFDEAENLAAENIFSNDAVPGLSSKDSFEATPIPGSWTNDGNRAPGVGPGAPGGIAGKGSRPPKGAPPAPAGGRSALSQSGSFTLSGDGPPSTTGSLNAAKDAGALPPVTPSIEANQASSRGSFEGATGSGSYDERLARPSIGSVHSGSAEAQAEAKKTHREKSTKSGSAELESQAAATKGSAGNTVQGTKRTDVQGPRGFVDQTTKVVVKLRTVSNPDQPIATPLPPDYELMEKLGEGGMGVVYLARQSSIDRQIALKMLQPQRATEPKVRARFLAEATATGDLDHPNIVPIYDLGCTATGALFYSMKRVRGIPWSDVFTKKTLEENIEILLRMADAVAFAHSRGIIHRDLKPENVMLGDFGEVLVMDWGLAVSVWKHGKAVHIDHSQAVAGSPSYMAPEMAGNKTFKLGFHSDVYLLGATLFELLTGRPPHAGKTLKDCLAAAQKNDIVTKIQYKAETEELMQIARKAMASDPKGRYATVQDFQQAVRGYLHHAESITLSQKAEQHLRHGQNSRSYDAFAQAIFGFREALAQWQGNREAEVGLQDATIQYALTAFEKEDYDLAASLLDRENSNHQRLLNQIQKAIRDRQQRQKLNWLATVAAVIFGLGFVGALITSNILVYAEQVKTAKAKDQAEKERQEATVARNEAVVQKNNAEQQRQKAELNEKKAQDQQKIAEQAAEEEKKAKELAEKAVEEEKKAKEATQKALLAAQAARAAEEKARLDEAVQKEKAKYQAYVARIGLASSKIEANSFDRAAELLALDVSDPADRNWEWGRLQYLCRLATKSYRKNEQRLDAAVFSPDERFVLTGGWDGFARLWDKDASRVVKEFQHGLYVHSAVLSPDGKYVATGSNEPDVRVWSVETGQVETTLKGHDGAIYALRFSKDGSKIFSGSADGTARVWNWKVADEKAQVFIRNGLGHTSAVRALDVSQDEQFLATASDDQLVIVWHLVERKQFVLKDHDASVFGLAFSPDRKHLVTVGADQQAIVWKYLPEDGKTLDPWKRILKIPHPSPLRAAAFAPDGKSFAVGGNDNAVHLWSIAGKSQQVLRGHAGWISSLQFSGTDGTLLSASFDGQAKLWTPAQYHERIPMSGDAEEEFRTAATASATGETVGGGLLGIIYVWNRAGERVRLLDEGHTRQILDVDASKDGRFALTSSSDGTARLWNLSTGLQVQQFTLGPYSVQAACLTPDGKYAVTAGNGRIVDSSGRTTSVCSVRVYQTSDGKMVHAASEEGDEGLAMAISSDGSEMLLGMRGHAVQRWSLEPLRKVQTLTGHNGAVAAVRFVEGTRTAASAAADKTVALWDLDTGREVAALPHDDTSLTDLSVSGDGKTLLSSVGDAVYVWNLATRQLVRKLPHDRSVVGMARSHAAPILAAACGDDTITVWNYETGAKLAELPSKPGATRAMAFSQDGKSLLSTDGADLRAWDWQGGTESMVLRRHYQVSAAVWRKNGTQVLTTGGQDLQIKLWDRATGRVIRKYTAEAHTREVNGLALSADESTMATFGDGGTVKLWDVDSGKLLRTLDKHKEPVRQAAFSQDGKTLVSCSEDRTARLWNVATGEPGPVLAGHAWWVLSACFSPDGKWVLTAGGDSVVKRWDARTGREAPWADDSGAATRSLTGHTGEINSVVFSPDSKRILTSSNDTTAKLWDAEKGQEILTLTGHAREVTQAGFSSDGLKILTAGRDGQVIVWPAIPWNDAAVARKEPVAQK